MPELDIRLHTSQETLLARAPEILSNPTLGLDIETTGLDPYTNDMICVQIANGHNNTVDVIDVRKDRCDHFFKIFFPQYKGKLCIQNAIFDLKWLKHYYDALYFDDVYDTKLAYQVINAGLDKKSNLEMQSKKYLGLVMDKGIRNEFLLPMFQIMDLSPHQLQYGALDAWVLPRIAELQKAEIAEANLEKIVWLENKVLPAFVKAELAGFQLDTDAWTKIYEEEQEIADQLRNEMLEYTNPLFNPNSDQQVKEEMGRLGIEVPVVYGKETTRAEFLQKIDHPFIKALLEYRTAEKRVTTYGEEFLNNLNPVTGLLHTSFKQVGTVTGRVASSGPKPLGPQ